MHRKIILYFCRFLKYFTIVQSAFNPITNICLHYLTLIYKVYILSLMTYLFHTLIKDLCFITIIWTKYLDLFYLLSNVYSGVEKRHSSDSIIVLHYLDQICMWSFHNIVDSPTFCCELDTLLQQSILSLCGCWQY